MSQNSIIPIRVETQALEISRNHCDGKERLYNEYITSRGQLIAINTIS